MSMAIMGGSTPANQVPPPPPPTGDKINDIENRFGEIEGKLNANPNDSAAKGDLYQLRQETQQALNGEEGKPGGGDLATLEKLESLLGKIDDLTNKTRDPNASKGMNP
jgi:hypothetical protein